MSLRLIAGEKGGLHLAAPKGQTTRPTLGRVRESLFMILRDRLRGARVLDLFAGSGALGLEALSRGAERAVFVENSRGALDALKANIAKTGWEARAAVVARDVFSYLKRPAQEGEGAGFDLLFLDPPYHGDLADKTMRLMGERAGTWVAGGGMVVAQAGKRDMLEREYGNLVAVRKEDYAETRIAFYARGELA